MPPIPPPHIPGRLPLTISGAWVGSLDNGVPQELRRLGRFPANATLAPRHDGHEGVHLVGAVTPLLEELGLALHAARLCPSPRGEVLTVRDLQGQALGRVDRSFARVLGLITRSVHLVLCTDQGVWIQQRARTKATDPGLWDTTVGGTCCDGETEQESLERELWEEAGLRLDALRRLRSVGWVSLQGPCLVDSHPGYQMEHIACMAAHLDADRVPVNQDGEVEAFALVSLDQMRHMMRQGQFTRDACVVLNRCLWPC